jgi:hypothetical protein
MNLPETMTTARFCHDCTQCQPLGRFQEYDLYFCNQGGFGPTVIARWGDAGHEYTSGLHSQSPALQEAEVRALDKLALL